MLTFIHPQFGATLWFSYSVFNFSYAMIYIPGTGIIAAYTDPSAGVLSPEFNQAVAIYLWAWFIVNMFYTIAAVRFSWVLSIDLIVIELGFMLLAVAVMTGDDRGLKAGYSVLLVAAFLSYRFPLCNPLRSRSLKRDVMLIIIVIPNRLGGLRWAMGRRYCPNQSASVLDVQGCLTDSLYLGNQVEGDNEG
ncbi:GPR1/FUN34/yaaH family-domain-containing protein [Aspergillus varians]